MIADNKIKLLTWGGAPLKKLTSHCINSKPGRNIAGRITIRHRMSRIHTPSSRLVNNKIFVLKNEFAQVIRIERDPRRSSFLALVRLLRSGYLCYILAPSGVHSGSILSLNPLNFNDFLFKKLKISSTALPLYRIPRGTFVCNVENSFLSGSKICKSAGSKAKIQAFSIKSGLASLLLPSGKTIFLPLNSHAFIGSVSNDQHYLRKFYKAGQNFNVGHRPSVRGVAMNPVDHPHGGGEGKTSGGRPSVTPWGRLTKGFKTISTSKKKKKMILKSKFLMSYNNKL
jgi:large subunit ribosomal protein L2